MDKWQYRTVVVVQTGRKIKRDKDGLYVDFFGFRLDPQIDRKEGYEFYWSEFLAWNEDTGFWDHETRVLNRMGQQGWRIQAIHPGGDSVGALPTRFIYVLMRPAE